jgi:light-regulated signal transduction histidine kinase (bacteriophytochrome)
MLEEDYRKLFDNEGNRLLGAIQQNSKKMSDLIDDLLTFSRLGRKPVQKTKLDMNQLVNNVLSFLDKAFKHNAEIRVDLLHSGQGDHSLINQVFVNLLSNSIKYSSKKENPLIEVSSQSEKGEIVYHIKDNGDGFDMKYADKLFGVFQRLHSDKEFPGTGVGLAIVQRIVYKHGGRIWAYAEPGKGATFSFTLPDP